MSTTVSNNAFGVMLVGGAIAVGVWVGVVATANGQPNSVGTNPNQFSTLRSTSQRAASPTGAIATDEIQRGIRAGLAAGFAKPQQ
jgi:hypothetical protein